MFSKADADQLREHLAGIQFLHGGSAAQPKLSDEAAALYASYAAYYGLNFSSIDSQLANQQTSVGVFQSAAYKLVCQHFLPSATTPSHTVFLLHGYFDHAGLYRHLIRHLLRRGIAVLVFDLPGHGLSSGLPASIHSFDEYNAAFIDCLRLAQEQDLPRPWTLIGQSTGAAVFMDTVLQGRLGSEYEIQKPILLGPLLRPRHWSRSKILFSLTRLFVSSTPRKFSKNSHDLEFLEFLETKDALQSRVLPRDWVQAMIDYINRFEAAPSKQAALQIIQSKGDGTVEWETNIPKILAKFPGSKVHWIEEGGHQLVNEALPYREKVFAVIDALVDENVPQS